MAEHDLARSFFSKIGTVKYEYITDGHTTVMGLTEFNEPPPLEEK